MGQITTETIKLIRKCHDRGEHAPLTQWEVSQLATAWEQLQAAKPEQQAQAGEPEPLCWISGGKITRWNGLSGMGFIGPVITLQSHREAIAKRDAKEQELRQALLACVEALEMARKSANARGFDLMDNSAPQKYWYELRDNCAAAITQAQEALK